MAKHQAAHVGETVRFSFILTQPLKKHPVSPRDIADYCIFALDDRFAGAELDPHGKYTLSYRMPEEWADREIRVRATAYRRYGRRDHMVVGGELPQVDSTADPSDRVIARDSITMLVYQPTLELALTPGADAFAFDTGRLVLRKADGTACSVVRARPPVGGFTVEGPDDNGTFTVRYEPTCGQVNLTGTTQAEFTVWDLAGHQHRHQAEILTP